MKNILATAAAAFLLVTSTGCSGFLDEELKARYLQTIHTQAAMVSKSE